MSDIKEPRSTQSDSKPATVSRIAEERLNRIKSAQEQAGKSPSLYGAFRSFSTIRKAG